MRTRTIYGTVRTAISNLWGISGEPCRIRTGDPLLKSVGKGKTKNHTRLNYVGFSSYLASVSDSRQSGFGNCSRTKGGQTKTIAEIVCVLGWVQHLFSVDFPLLLKQMFRSKELSCNCFFLHVRELSVS